MSDFFCKSHEVFKLNELVNQEPVIEIQRNCAVGLSRELSEMHVDGMSLPIYLMRSPFSYFRRKPLNILHGGSPFMHGQFRVIEKGVAGRTGVDLITLLI